MARAVMCGHPRKGRRGEIGMPRRAFWGHPGPREGRAQVGGEAAAWRLPPIGPLLRNPYLKGEEGLLLRGVFMSLPFGS